jgi:anti-sigma regulatory factor (Ser/Thr protein kinase)
MCWKAETDLLADADAPRIARAFLNSWLGEQLGWTDDAGLFDDAALIASELVSNAVRAGSHQVGFALLMHRDELIVQAVDDAEGWPTRRSVTSDETTGRGLLLIAALSTTWSAERIAGGGKRVWASLPISRGMTGALACDVPS